MMKTKFLILCTWVVCVTHLSVSFALPFHRKTQMDRTRPPRVQLRSEPPRHVVIDNGLVQVTLSVPDGFVTGVKYGGIDNLLETRNHEDNRGYWDVVWYKPRDRGSADWMRGTNFSVVMQTEEQIELSFTKTWGPPSKGSAPLNVDKRIIVRCGISGFYMYSILERLKGWPDVDMDQIRIVLKLSNDQFHYMAISDDIQRIMPTPQEREAGVPLAYKEGVRLKNGEVDDKYQYAMENQDIKVHGWVTKEPHLGFWIIKPSNEFCAGGPNKQDLTGHVGPTLLMMFSSTHYAGKDFNTEYRNGEPWKKVLGPVFVYLNSMSSVHQINSPAPDQNGYQTLWQDAKNQMVKEVNSWPYSFPRSEDFTPSDKRGNVSGRLLTRDGEVKSMLQSASFAYVGLATPGDEGSWQHDSKGYQFWTRADKQGNFLITNVRPGDYNLYAWVPGFLGDYKYGGNITIKPGSQIKLQPITYIPPRNGPTLWEIGIPDRSAAEFFVPTPIPGLINRLFVNQPRDGYRQYGLWEQYTHLYPQHDLVYHVGVHRYQKDWFFAHVTRDLGNKTFRPTTWQIKFELQSVNPSSNYTIQLALAAATYSTLEVRINNPSRQSLPHFTTGEIGKDNAIARHGIHGLHRLYSLNVPGHQLMKGDNSIYFTQTNAHNTWEGVLYDYIRLEGPRGS